MSDKDIWDFYDELFEPETGSETTKTPFVSRYDPRRYVDTEVLTELEPYTASNIVSADEPIAVADNDDNNLTIEVYERRRDSLFELPKQLVGKLDDFILHVDYWPEENASATEYGNSLFLSSHYFGFDEKDVEEVQGYLNEFSENGFNAHITGTDLH